MNTNTRRNRRSREQGHRRRRRRRSRTSSSPQPESTSSHEDGRKTRPPPRDGTWNDERARPAPPPATTTTSHQPTTPSTPKRTLKIWISSLLYTPQKLPADAGENAGEAETHLQPNGDAEDDAEEGKPQSSKSATALAFPPSPRRPQPYLQHRNADRGIPHPPAAGAAGGG